MLTTEEIFVLVSQFSLIIPLVTGVVFYNRLPIVFKVFYWGIVTALITELCSVYLKWYVGTTNLPVYNVFVFFEFCFFAYVFDHWFRSRAGMARVVRLATMLFFVAATWNLVKLGLAENNSVAHFTEGGFMVLFCLLYYYLLFKEHSSQSLFHDPMFWFVTGTFIYFALNLFLFALTHYLNAHHRDWSNKGYNYHGAVNILSYLIFTRMFLSFRKWTR